MFNNKKNVDALSNRKYDTNIFTGMRLSGDVKFTGSVYFDGRLKGNIANSASSKSKEDILVLGPSAKIVGNISANKIYLLGDVDGNIYSLGELFLLPGSSVQGDIHYNLMEMSHGAKVNGRFNYLNSQENQTSTSSSSTTDKK